MTGVVRATEKTGRPLVELTSICARRPRLANWEMTVPRRLPEEPAKA